MPTVTVTFPAGEFAWVAPANIVGTAQVDCWGSGEWGQSGGSDGVESASGRGGNGGAFARKTFTPVPGLGYLVEVAPWADSTSLSADGDIICQAHSGPDRGIPGIGDITNDGGEGGAQSYDGTVSAYGGGGGAGGSIAGPGQDGQSQQFGSSAGVGVSGAGSGEAGRDEFGNPSEGGPAAAPGGGGGGGGVSGDGQNQADGGQGADGMMIITYTVATALARPTYFRTPATGLGFGLD